MKTARRNILQRVWDSVRGRKAKTISSVGRRTTEKTTDLMAPIKRSRQIRGRKSFPRTKRHDPDTKCKATKRGANHWIGKPGSKLLTCE